MKKAGRFGEKRTARWNRGWEGREESKGPARHAINMPSNLVRIISNTNNRDTGNISITTHASTHAHVSKFGCVLETTQHVL